LKAAKEGRMTERFIRLTAVSNLAEGPIWVNLAHVTRISPLRDGNTKLRLVGVDDIIVKETPEQIFGQTRSPDPGKRRARVAPE
jgi:hypothetical protein